MMRRVQLLTVGSVDRLWYNWENSMHGLIYSRRGFQYVHSKIGSSFKPEPGLKITYAEVKNDYCAQKYYFPSRIVRIWYVRTVTECFSHRVDAMGVHDVEACARIETTCSRCRCDCINQCKCEVYSWALHKTRLKWYWIARIAPVFVDISYSTAVDIFSKSTCVDCCGWSCLTVVSEYAVEVCFSLPSVPACVPSVSIISHSKEYLWLSAASHFISLMKMWFAYRYYNAYIVRSVFPV